MPGIAGIIGKTKEQDFGEKLNLMISSALHEDFYTHGTFIHRELDLFIGYTSLKGSFSDCMPILNEKGDLFLFLTGECYFDQSLIEELKRRGHIFDNRNASILIHLYEEQGDRFIQNLNGWFNGFLIDLRKGIALLFNDRCGIRRVYYHEGKDAFYFASEAKSLLGILPNLRQFDPRSLGEFIAYDCVMEGRTYFRDIFLLPSGSTWSFSNGHIRKEIYHNPAKLENLTKVPPEAFFDEFANTFSRILPRYFRGPSIGVSLTGGLDTRTIMACYRADPGALPCYTFGGKFKDIFDVRIAPKVARDCNQPHTIFRIDDAEFLHDYPAQLERSIWITDGIVPVDMVDMLHFNKMARTISQVRMTGKYGSQVLKNIVAFKDRSPYPGLVAPEFERYLTLARSTASDVAKSRNFSFLLMNEIPWWWNGMLCLESSQVEVRSPFLDNDLIELLYRGPGPQLTAGAKLQLQLIARSKPSLLAIPTTGTHGGTIPIVAEFRKQIIKALMIADKLYIRERLPYSLTHIVARLDHSILGPLGLNKVLFGYTEFRRYRNWYRDELSPYLKEIFLSSRTQKRDYLNHPQLKKMLFAHISGQGTYLREIRKVLQIEMINRVLIERQY